METFDYELDDENPIHLPVITLMLCKHSLETKNFIYEAAARLSLEAHNAVNEDWIIDRVCDFVGEEERTFTGSIFSLTEFLMFYNSGKSAMLRYYIYSEKELHSFIDQKITDNPYLKLNKYIA